MAGLHDTGGGGMDGLGVQSWTVAELSPCYPHLEASLLISPISRWSCKLLVARGWRSTEHGHVTGHPTAHLLWIIRVDAVVMDR